ncbi:hypothetical protein TIFTF001_032096 [Ficus carica]|uniref:Uncharacterized protein n=1 Tax=Ficus carica TaxID=3494 RepID=A0AA88DXW2_FICCA|nr:hypothetical protein TIFTF001_032096 [Ficus carica]
MATTSSLIFMAADESTSSDAAVASGARAVRSEEAKPEGERAATRTRGRKPSNKAANAKKQPQRGLGVAQLERLRQEERNQKIAEMLQLQLQLQPPNFSGPAAAVAGADPLESVPVQYGAGGFGGHYRLMAVPQPQHDGGFGVGIRVGVGSHYHYGFGSISPPVMNPDQTSSKELSSKPKPQLLVPPFHDQSLDIHTFKFFPGRKNAAGSIFGGGGGSKEMLQIMPNSEILGSGETSSYYYHQANANSSAGTSTYGADTSNHVDLALKL